MSASIYAGIQLMSAPGAGATIFDFLGLHYKSFSRFSTCPARWVRAVRRQPKDIPGRADAGPRLRHMVRPLMTAAMPKSSPDKALFTGASRGRAKSRVTRAAGGL